MARNDNRTIFKNSDSLYQKKLDDRGIRNIKQYASANLKYPSSDELAILEQINHIWKQGDSFEKLAFKYYKDSNFWWIIPFINQKPTEQHFSVGDSVYIPLPLYAVTNIIGY